MKKFKNYKKLEFKYNDLCQVVEDIADSIGQARECVICENH